MFTKIFKNCIPYCSLKLVHQLKNRIANAFDPKDVVNNKLSSHIVYNFIFSSSNATYYGQTQSLFSESFWALHLDK